MNSKIIIIFGSNGYVGSELVKHFELERADVRCFSFRPSSKRDVITTFRNYIIETKPFAVINAGASQIVNDTESDLEELITSNVFLPSAVASELCYHSPKTIFINFGTSWQTGEQGGLEPMNAYAASKESVFPFFNHFSLAGLRIGSIKLYDTYGPNDKRKKVVNLLINSVKKQEKINMSGGDQAMDLLHIKDVLSAVEKTIMFLSENIDGTHFITPIRSGRVVTIRELTDIIDKISGKRLRHLVNFGVMPYRSRERFRLFNDRILLPNWRPVIELEEGLEELLCKK